MNLAPSLPSWFCDKSWKKLQILEKYIAFNHSMAHSEVQHNHGGTASYMSVIVYCLWYSYVSGVIRIAENDVCGVTPSLYPHRVLAGKPKLSPFLVNWEKSCFYLQYFLYNIDNDKSKQKDTQSHSSYKIQTSHFWLGKFLSYLNWEESVKRTLYGLANTLPHHSVANGQQCNTAPYHYAVYWLPPASSAFLLARKCNWLAGIMVMRNAICVDKQTSIERHYCPFPILCLHRASWKMCLITADIEPTTFERLARRSRLRSEISHTRTMGRSAGRALG